MLDVVIEVLASLYARLVGRPWQRRRAERLIRHGKVRCVLFDADGHALPGRALDGVAEASEKRLTVQGVDLWVRGVDGPPVEGPLGPFARDGLFHPADGDLVFSPRTLIYRLRLHDGSTVRWSVLAFQAEQVLALLGLDVVRSAPGD